ncbi:hypothetical protein GOP47_0030498 [Adiantum capillus-veneris]|nr:hypothetical protein GOP47_0030498 [Adiantum capillus-veneris]
MSYVDNGEDEVDYGEAEDQNPAFQAGGHASTYAEDDDALQEDGYEDLYDDMNIGYFEPSAAEISSQKDAVDSGENLGLGIREAEVSIAHMKGLSVGSALFSNQKNALPEIQLGKVPGIQVKGSSVALIKEEGSVASGEEATKQLGVARSGLSVSMPQPQVTVTLDAKPKVTTPAISISINQARSMEEKDLGMPGIHLQASATMKAKDESDVTRTAMEFKVAPAATYPPVPSKGNGMIPAEPLPTPNEYERAAIADKPASGKPPDNHMVRARGLVDIVERGYAGDGKASQAVSNRDSTPVPTMNDYTMKHNVQSHNGGGGTMLFVGELHWWTTDVELETALLEFGALKNLKFFEERASGKSKGYCQVEFYDHAAALACKEGMNGRKFHGRSCLVAFANPRSIMQMGTAQVEKAQAQVRAQQAQVQARKAMADPSGNNRGTSTYQGGDNNRSYGRPTTGAGRGSHGQTAGGRGPARGRTNMSSKGLSGNGGNVGNVTPYGQGLVGPMGSHPSGMMMPQAMMGQGYDPGYGPPRGSSGYGGYVLPGPPFTGMVQPFPTMGPGTLPGVAPHVNPAFFGRNSTANGMGMMGGSGMEGSQSAMWGDANMSGWGADEHDRRGREASYDDDAADSDYTYSNELAYEKSRGAEELNRADAEWPERRRHRDREGYRDQREREREGEKDDWERDKPWRVRNKGRAVADEDEKEDLRLRSREEEYGKRRRLGNER